jgi:hypothetical protein
MFWFVGLVFYLDVLDEFGVGFWATLVSNNREGTKELPRDVVEGYEGVNSGLGHVNITCLSDAV